MGIPWTEIQLLGFKSRDQFADCLEMWASFPTISFSIQVLKDPKPLWLGKANTLPRPRPTSAPPRRTPPTKPRGLRLLNPCSRLAPCPTHPFRRITSATAAADGPSNHAGSRPGWLLTFC